MSGIVVVGDISTDVVALLRAELSAGSDTPATIRFCGGGQAANTAAWLAVSGVPVTIVGVVGADPAGEARLAELTAIGVHCAVRRTTSASTGSVIVLTAPAGTERTMVTDRGANLLLTPADIDAGLPGAADAVHLHLSGYALLDAASRPAARYALAAAAAQGWSTSVDTASVTPLRLAGPQSFLDWVRPSDLLLATDDEAAVLAPEAGSAVERASTLARTVGNAVIMRGATGAIWADGDGGLVEVPAEPATALDPTGAGDAFAAGLLAAWVTGSGPLDALRGGHLLGAQAVARFGARP